MAVAVALGLGLTIGVGVAIGVGIGLGDGEGIGARVAAGGGEGEGVGDGDGVGDVVVTDGVVCFLHARARPPNRTKSATPPITTPSHGALFFRASVVCAPKVSFFGEGGAYGSTLSPRGASGTSGMGAVS